MYFLKAINLFSNLLQLLKYQTLKHCHVRVPRNGRKHPFSLKLDLKKKVKASSFIPTGLCVIYI